MSLKSVIIAAPGHAQDALPTISCDLTYLLMAEFLYIDTCTVQSSDYNRHIVGVCCTVVYVCDARADLNGRRVRTFIQSHSNISSPALRKGHLRLLRSTTGYLQGRGASVISVLTCSKKKT